MFISTRFREDRLDSRPLGEKASFEGGLISRLSMAVLVLTKALGSDKALRLLRPQAGLQQVRVADLPGTPAEGHSSLLVLDHSKLNH